MHRGSQLRKDQVFIGVQDAGQQLAPLHPFAGAHKALEKAGMVGPDADKIRGIKKFAFSAVFCKRSESWLTYPASATG